MALVYSMGRYELHTDLLLRDVSYYVDVPTTRQRGVRRCSVVAVKCSETANCNLGTRAPMRLMNCRSFRNPKSVR